MRHCDAVLVIAPESEGQLECLCAEVLEEGRKGLNCSLEAIRLTADKWRLNRHLQTAGIPAVETRVWNPSEPVPAQGVIKPRDGAGCEETFVLDVRSVPPVLNPESRWIWQPWVPGPPASLSLMVGENEVELLSCNRIHCENQEGRLHVHELETGGFDGNLRFEEEARALATRIVAAVPGLRGYVGVDVMWRGESLTVLEINPRLTLTYTGLAMPLAERMFQVFGCMEVPA